MTGTKKKKKKENILVLQMDSLTKDTLGGYWPYEILQKGVKQVIVATNY